MSRSSTGKLSGQLTALGTVAPEVIARRFALLAVGNHASSARNQREITRMSSEKIEAAWLAWTAMSVEAAHMQWTALSMVWSMWMPKSAASSWSSWYEHAGTQLATAGLAPYVRMVKANRTRLSRKTR